MAERATGVVAPQPDYDGTTSGERAERGAEYKVSRRPKPVLTLYCGEITIRRLSPLQGVKVKVSRATLVYEAAGIPSKLLKAVQDPFNRASDGKVVLRIESLL